MEHTKHILDPAGKTMQCSAFLSGMFKSGLASRALIVAPKTLLLHWQKELTVCGLGGRTFSYFGSNESDREQALKSTASKKGLGGVLLTTYGMVRWFKFFGYKA
jgi:SNF2 family DNA or RNA helicase